MSSESKRLNAKAHTQEKERERERERKVIAGVILVFLLTSIRVNSLGRFHGR